MTMYSAAVTHSHCEDCGQATMRLEYEKVHDRVVPCYCLAAVYRAIGVAITFLPPLPASYRVNRGWTPQLFACFPHHQNLHMVVYRLMAQAT